MKSVTTIIVCLFVACFMASCGGDEDDYIDNQGKERNYQIYERPNWDTLYNTNLGAMQVDKQSMTFVTILPDSITVENTGQDLVVVMCGEEVRGILSYYKQPKVWMGLVFGDTGDTLEVRYYSYIRKRIYYTSTFPFEIDSHNGTLDNPMTLGLYIWDK